MKQKETRASQVYTPKNKLENPIPLRLDADLKKHINTICTRTGMSQAAVLRVGLSWVLPRIVAGNVNPFGQ